MGIHDFICVECGNIIIADIKLYHSGGLLPQEKSYICPFCDKEIDTTEPIKDSSGKVIIK